MYNVEDTKDSYKKWALRVFIIAILDALTVIAAFVSAFLLRFEFSFYPLTNEYRDMILTVIPIFATIGMEA